jgi:Rab11 family-interacting protein 1/2/5
MWTHVKVTVCKARALISKGKDGTNDALVKIALGKEKYQTSVKERAIAADSVVWNEECELAIPKQGNKAEIVLTALHRNRNFIGDEFLGAVNIPLSDFADVYDRPISKWYSLNSKAGKPNTKERGELEVRIQFSMKTPKAGAGSLSDLTEKERHRSSLGRLATSLGGSLFSLGKDKEKKEKKNKNQKGSSSTLPGRGKGQGQFGAIPEQEIYKTYIQSKYDADPGVISDEDGEGDDEFKFEELSHKSSKSSLSVFQDPLPLPVSKKRRTRASHR